MKWVRPKELTVRRRTFFAIFPVSIGREIRWLEKVKVREVYKYSDLTGFYYWEKTDFEPPD